MPHSDSPEASVRMPSYLPGRGTFRKLSFTSARPWPPYRRAKRELRRSLPDVDSLTDLVHAIEDREGILSDWSLPGAHTEAAAFDVARTVCRRAERCIVRLIEDGDAGRAPHPQVLPYINRLSDLIWLFGRLLERESGVDSRLRGEQHKGARWSKAGETSEKRLFNAIKKPPCIVRLVSGQRSAAAIFRDRSMLIHRQSRTWKHWVRLASMIFSRILVRH